MKSIIWLLTALAALAFIGCCSCKTGRGATIVLEFNDEKAKAAAGDTIAVSLDYPPTAGFEWTLKSHDKDYLSLVDNKSHVKIDAGNMYRNIWYFVCLKPGETKIEFSFKRESLKGKGMGIMEEETKVFEIMVK